jgi:phosphoglycolate phosphatase
MRYPLVVFDFDGTLADSLDRSLALFNDLAPKLGLRPLTDLEAARRTPTKTLLKQMGVRFWRLPRVVRAFQDAAADHADELPLHAGVADLLRELHAGGHRLGVLSSNREATIRTCLRRHGVEHLFAFVVGYPKLFGKAKALRKILRHETCGRDGLLFVGDELRDLDAGRKAGVATAAVTWGFQAVELLEAAGPTAVVRTPGGLLAVVG